MEARPQALEWLFSLACGYRFHVSADNLGAPDDVNGGNLAFKQQVLVQALAWQERGLPQRAQRFLTPWPSTLAVACGCGNWPSTCPGSRHEAGSCAGDAGVTLHILADENIPAVEHYAGTLATVARFPAGRCARSNSPVPMRCWCAR